MEKIFKILFPKIYKKLEIIEESIIDSRINVFFYVDGKLLQGVSMKFVPPIGSMVELNFYEKLIIVKVNSIRYIDYKSNIKLNCQIEIEHNFKKSIS